MHERAPTRPKAQSWLPRKFLEPLRSSAEILEPLRSSAAMSDSEEESGASSGLVTSSELPLWGCSDAFTDPANRDEPVIMGIDEAGRGPVLGPMVYGSAFCFLKDEARMKAMGFMDSKQLTEAKRDQLWAELQTCGFIGWSIRVLDAKFIAGGMLRKANKCAHEPRTLRMIASPRRTRART